MTASMLGPIMRLQGTSPPMPRDPQAWGWDDHMVSFPFGWVGLLVVLAIIVILFIYLARKGATCSFQQTPGDILSKRYARGDISREEFERIKQDLEGKG